MNIEALLRLAIQQNASDLYIKVGVPPVLRVYGQLINVSGPNLTPEETEHMAREIMPPFHLRKWERWHEADFAYALAGEGRFRVNVFQQRDTVAIVIRRLSVTVPTFEELGLPPSIEYLSNQLRGLVLCTGVAGSGKTTTLASMISHINNTRRCHIVTIEDPIEIVFEDKQSLVSQREIGADTMSYARALKNVLRETPDVILIGEMRDAETVNAAISAAQTGHLVLSTLHTINASETINRLMDFFPPAQHVQVRQMLASSLHGIISQRLLSRADGAGRVPAVEVLLNTPTVREYLLDEAKTPLIPALMAKGEYEGMQTMDQALAKAVASGLVTTEEALLNAASSHDLALKLRELAAQVQYEQG